MPAIKNRGAGPRFSAEVQRVKDYLRAAILRAELLEGMPIYEDSVRSQTGASTRVVKQALMELTIEGLIWRKQHVGTRVADKLPTIGCLTLPPIRSIAVLSSIDRQAFTSNHYTNHVMSGIRRALQPPGNILEIFNPKESGKSLDGVPPVDVAAIKPTVQGVISVEANSVQVLNNIVRAGLPVVAVDFYAVANTFDVVCVDHLQAGYDATMHLWDLGHRRIAFVGEMQSAYSTDPAWQDRLTGYLRAIAIHGGPTPRPILLDIQRHPHLVRQLLPEFHRMYSPSAYVIATGALAEAVVDTLATMNLEYPRHYSLVSADDVNGLSGNQRLSRVHVDYEELGRTAVQVLATRIACRPMPTVRTIIQGTLKPGATSGPAILPTAHSSA